MQKSLCSTAPKEHPGGRAPDHASKHQPAEDHEEGQSVPGDDQDHEEEPAHGNPEDHEEGTAVVGDAAHHEEGAPVAGPHHEEVDGPQLGNSPDYEERKPEPRHPEDHEEELGPFRRRGNHFFVNVTLKGCLTYSKSRILK